MPASVRRSITIDRPIEDVFAALTNVENTERWFPADVKEWWTSDPPHGLGSTRHAVIRVGWFRSENDAVATVYQPPRRAVMTGTSKHAPFEATLTFMPIEAATRVDATVELRLRGPATLVGPMVMHWYGAKWELGLGNLKALMESGEL